jgi:hypothetical protein
LTSFLHHDLAVNAGIEVIHANHHDRYAQANAELSGLFARKDVGAVFVIGSPISNSLADPIARRIVGDKLEDSPRLPVEFRWAFGLSRPLGAPPYLSSPDQVARRSEGIALRGDKQTRWPRQHDEVIYNDLRKRTWANALYEDCGLVMISAVGEGPLAVLCAGHGGVGTIAAVLALREQTKMSALISREDNLSPGRAAAVVVVERSKPSDHPLDDLVFDRRYGEADEGGWRIAWPDLW